MSDELVRFRELTRTIADLERTEWLLNWDRQVMMPPAGAEQRSQELAAQAGAVHEKVCAPELGALIEELEQAPPQGAEARADLREARRRHDRAVKVPAELVIEHARVCAMAQPAWEEARTRDDFQLFLPHLIRVLEVSREVATAVSDGGDLYDALLQEYEPGMTRAVLDPLLEALEQRLVPLLEQIARETPAEADEVLTRPFPVQAQEAFALSIARDMGFDTDAGRLDRSTHPFTSGHCQDVRITGRFSETRLASGLFAVIHEAGHALYQQGLDRERYRDPAGSYCSLGVHESQSRLWENMVARAPAFWSHYLPRLKRAFPGALDDVDLERFVAALNHVQATPIRVEADEATYNMHILLRYRLETAMLSGDLAPADLPGAWDEGMQRLLGITPASQRQGCLQDVHWAAGLIGYFPTYTLGNLLAAQLMLCVLRDLPDLDDQLARGDLLPLRRWLGDSIHRHGRTYLAPDLIQRATGAPLSAGPFLDYLETKYLGAK